MPRAHCANPVFVQWLEYLRDGEEKDSNRCLAYSKAAKALKQHQEVLNHPKDCLKIKGIGPKIVEALTVRHREANSGGDVGGTEGIAVVKSTKKITARKASSSSSSGSQQPKKRGRKPQQPSSSDADEPTAPAPGSGPGPAMVGGEIRRSITGPVSWG